MLLGTPPLQIHSRAWQELVSRKHLAANPSVGNRPPEPRCTHLPKMDLTLACSAFPCAVLPPTGQNPLMPSSFLAFLHASANALKARDMVFLARTDAALLTILPALFLIKVAFVRPPDVFSFLPRKTWDLPSLPLAILLTTRFFIAFIAFGAFIAFIARAMGSDSFWRAGSLGKTSPVL